MKNKYEKLWHECDSVDKNDEWNLSDKFKLQKSEQFSNIRKIFVNNE